jgi:putative sigma-54 modulation protein
MNTKVHAVHFSADSKLLDYVKEKIQKLKHFYDRIESADVYLKLENNHKKIKEKIVEIKVNIPGHKLFCMNKSTTFEKAFSLALDSCVELIKEKKASH